jgi:N-acetylglucosamine repressor
MLDSPRVIRIEFTVMARKSGGRRDIRVLQSIFFLRTPTRNEIARHSATSPVTLTEILGRLRGRGLVERSGRSEGRSGRPSATYRLGEKVGYSIGVSVEEGEVRIVGVDSRHKVICGREITLKLSSDPATHLDDILRQISTELKRIISGKELNGRCLRAIGIAPPGMVDTEKGVWLHGLQVSGITHVALRDTLEEMFGLPVVVEDMSRCLAWREADRRSAEDARDLVYLNLGAGVGAGILIGREPYLGAHGLAGEVGHLIVEENGTRCPCGSIGCLETVVSRAGILNRFQQRLSEGVISSLQRYRIGREEPLTLEAILDAGAAGDRLAQSTMFEIGTFLGDACSKIIKLYNPRTLFIGGPVAILGDLLREPTWIKVRQKVIPEMLVDLEMSFAASEPIDGALGAALLAERKFWKSLDADCAPFT